MMEKLFIYGTLAPGESNHGVVENIPGHWEAARIKGTLFKQGWGTDLKAPAVIPSENGEDVNGYLFSSKQLSEHWAMLDEFEGSEYKRVLVQATKDSGETVEAFVYALNE